MCSWFHSSGCFLFRGRQLFTEITEFSEYGVRTWIFEIRVYLYAIKGSPQDIRICETRNSRLTNEVGGDRLKCRSHAKVCTPFNEIGLATDALPTNHHGIRTDG